MVTQEVNSATGGMIEKPPVERDMDMAEAGEASREAGEWSGKTTRVSFLDPSEQWEHNWNGKRLKNETSEPVNALGDWRSRMERTVRQQWRKATQLHQTVHRMARMLEAHRVHEEVQWHGMIEWLEDRETKWDESHRDDVIWGRGVADMTAEVLAKPRIAKWHRPRARDRKEETRPQGRTGEA